MRWSCDSAIRSLRPRSWRTRRDRGQRSLRRHATSKRADRSSRDLPLRVACPSDNLHAASRTLSRIFPFPSQSHQPRGRAGAARSDENAFAHSFEVRDSVHRRLLVISELDCHSTDRRQNGASVSQLKRGCEVAKRKSSQAPQATTGAKMMYLIKRREAATREELLVHWFANHMPLVIKSQHDAAASGRLHARRYIATLFDANADGAIALGRVAQLW